MGNYLNPGNSGFEEIRNSRYVDKSGLIGLINDIIGTKQKLTCISRPRRFGKSYAAQMLCAYYDKTCDSSALFDDLEIAVNEKFNSTYKQHLTFQRKRRLYQLWWSNSSGINRRRELLNRLRTNDILMRSRSMAGTFCL